MRISELSRQSGVPIPTIKYYLREELLPPGEHTSPNQVQYEELHLRRLKLIRALMDIGQLPVAVTREVLGAISAAEGDVFKTLGVVQYAIVRAQHPRTFDVDTPAEAAADEFAARRGWRMKQSNPVRPALAGLLAILEELGHHEIIDRLDDYAEQAERLAEIDLQLLEPGQATEDLLENVVVATVLGDALVSLLRRLAAERLAAERTRGAHH